MRLLPRGSGPAGCWSLLMSRVRPLNTRAGGTEPQARGTPCGLQPARERPCLRRPARAGARLPAPSEGLALASATSPRPRAATGVARCEAAQPRTSRPRPRTRSEVRDVVWAQVRDRVPEGAAIATKLRESSPIRRRRTRARFRCKSPGFAWGGQTPENRGVPGSSPGLAIRSPPSIPRSRTIRPGGADVPKASR
jgi:hypothetical protein